MTRNAPMDRQRLAAFVDGELSAEEAAEVVMHLADHPQDQAWVDDLMASNAALAEAFADPLDEPVPDRLREAVLGPVAAPTAQVIPFRRRALPAAAGLLLATGIAASVMLLLPAAGTGLRPGPVAAGSDLHAALDSLPSGMPEAIGGAQELMILATLPVEGGFCREVEVIDRAAATLDLALACRSGGEWQLQVVLSEPLSEGTSEGFVPAGSAATAGLGLFLDQIGAGAALAPEAEAIAIGSGWKP